MKPRRHLTVVAMVATLVLALATVALASPAGGGGQRGGDRVPVIVVFEDHVEDSRAAAHDMARRNDAELSFIYEHALKGFAADVPQGRVDNVERDRRVDYVERDRPVQTQARTVPTGIDRVDADDNSAIGIDGTDDQRVDADVAVLDTGIDLDHPDLDVVGGVSCLEHSGGPPWQRTYSCVDGGDDGHGHGTHVSGTIAALDDGTNTDGTDVVGVAPGARLHAVKVLDDNGSGSTGSVIAGIDWVTDNAVGNGGPIQVANMSLGGSGESQAVDDALEGSYNAGVSYAVAAGNSEADVDGYWPAGSPWVLTVSALADFDGETGGNGDPTCRTDEDDTFANFSNYGDTPGQDVDVIAPGVCILSTYPGGGYADGWSGTSMASPHVAGAAALLASSGSSATDIVGDVVDGVDGDGAIETNGDTDWTADDDPDGTKEPLADVGDSTVFAPTLVDTGDGGGDTNSAPTADFTSSCTDLTCDFDGGSSSDSDGSITSYDWDFGEGTTGTGQTVSHTYDSDGTYTVTLTVTDDDGATDSTSQDVTVSSSDGGDGTESAGGPHIGDLDGASTNDGSTWTATVTALVHDADGDPLSGATVNFDYTSERNAVNGSTSCSTGTDGRCQVSVGGVPKRDGSITFTVTGVDVADYSATDNHDPDGDSDGTTITVAKP